MNFNIPSNLAHQFDKFVEICIALNEFAGLYPIHMTRFLICIGCMALLVIPQIVQIFQEWRDLPTVLETCSVLFTILLAVLKSFVWIFNKGTLQPFIDFMLTDYWDLVKTDASKYLQIYATYAKKITKGYLLLICNALLFFFSLPVIDIFIAISKDTGGNGTKHFPFVALYPTAFYHFPFYEIIYISQIVATSICGTIILATDTLIATALFHTCGHFKILQENLKHLHVDICCKDNSKSINPDLRQLKMQMRYIIQHHQMLLWFCDNMEKNFNPILLLQTLASTFIICLVGLQVSTTLTDRSKLIKYISYLIMALFQLLLFCYPGDILMQQSSNVSHAMYSIKWYELSVPIKREVGMILLRGQKPSYITAGKLYVMHLENFSAVLSSALSYLTMLRSINA